MLLWLLLGLSWSTLLLGWSKLLRWLIKILRLQLRTRSALRLRISDWLLLLLLLERLLLQLLRLNLLLRWSSNIGIRIQNRLSIGILWAANELL